MNKKVFILLLIATLFAVACNDAAKPPVVVSKTPQSSPPANAPAPASIDSHGHSDGKDAPRITLAEAKKDFDAKTAVFIDTHAPEQFAQRHITGAINVPGNNMEPYMNKIPKGKKIIAYCS